MLKSPADSRLVAREPLLGVVAGDADPLVIVREDGSQVARSGLLRDIRRVAAQLPDGRHVINVCTGRYAFLVSFAAALLRGQVSLLPPSRAPAVLSALASEYPDTYLLGEGSLGDGAVPMHRLELAATTSATGLRAGEAGDPGPSIPLEQLAVILFTSGSTGRAVAHPKTWRTLVDGARGNARAMLSGLPGRALLTATVPPQHMYGFETSILLPLQNHCAVSASRPLFPEDVRTELEAARHLAAISVLVTTPVHLRALTAASVPQPPVTAIWSATAPLSSSLASDAERRFAAPVHEIYGCTEAGIMATRRTTRDEPWRSLAGFMLAPTSGGTQVRAAHLPAPVVLEDLIEIEGERQFRLVGRGTDLIDVAGKRASLGDLNARLLTVRGVRDGVIFMPDAKAGSVGRTAALVVAPGHSRESLLAALRQLMDPAFLPRPLVLVDSLPRSDSSKLPRAALLELLAAHHPLEPSLER